MENIKPFILPKVSVIITCYNLSKYLIECVNSVLNQTYKNFEIIIVNDCSTDNTKEILDTLSPDIKKINLENNLGQLGAFLEGLKIAKGEFIALVDADDILLPDYLNIHIQAHMQTSVAFTSAAQIEIDENSTLHSFVSLATPVKQAEYLECKTEKTEDFFNKIYKNEKFNIKIMDIKKYPFGSWNYNPTTSAVMRKSTLLPLLKFKNIQNWRKCADKLIFSYLHLIGGSATISIPLFAYRRHTSNISSVNPVMGNFRYLKPDAISLFIDINKKVRYDTLQFIFSNWNYFCKTFNPLNTKKLLFRIIFSFDRYTIKRVFKSFFVR